MPGHFPKQLLLGFTIIELVIVMALLGILSAVAMPRFFDTSAYYSRLFYDEVISSIRYAQKYSIGTGCHTQVEITATTLTLSRRVSCTTGDFTLSVKDPSTAGSSAFIRTAPTGITMSTGGGSFPMYFNSLGQAKQVSDDVISNFSVIVDTRTINITGQTGYTE